MRHARVVAVLAVLGGLVAACGDGSEPVVAPLEVPVELVPTALGPAALSIQEDEGARDAFTEIGSDALIADGRLWTIRSGELLVATLQISTAKPTIDLTTSDDRTAIGSKIMPSGAPTIFIGDVEVQALKVNKKSTYLWFAKDLFQVLQVKSEKFNSEDLLTRIIEFQETKDSWHPLDTDEEEVLES